MKYYFQSINKFTGWTLTWECCKIGSISDDDKQLPILSIEAKIFNDMLLNLQDVSFNDFYEYRIFPQDCSLIW